MARKYHQGIFEPRNPHKYVGDVKNIQFRSSWELRVMIRFDEDDSILKWASEEVFIPYVSPKDGQVHHYFVDFIIQYRNKSGEIKKAAIEIKPHVQTLPPKQPKRVTKFWMESVETYAVNQAKWEAAKNFCTKNNMEFIVLTEKELGLAK